MAHNEFLRDNSRTGMALEAIFTDYQHPDQAMDRLLEVVDDDQTSADDVNNMIHDLYGGVRQPCALLFTGEGSEEYVLPLSRLTWDELRVKREYVFLRPDERDEATLKAEYVEIIKWFVNEARDGIRRAVEYSHAPVKVRSLELTPRSHGIGRTFTDTKTGETIVLGFGNDVIGITSKFERTIDGRVWRTEPIRNRISASECEKNAPIDLLVLSPSQSEFAKECLSQFKPTFIERNRNDCDWNHPFTDDGERIEYKDPMVTCLVLEGEFPLMSRISTQHSGYQNPIFADTTNA